MKALTHSRKILANVLLMAAILFSLLVPAGSVGAYTVAQSDIPPVNAIYPVNDTIIYASTDHPRALPTFRWEAVAGAKSYKVEIDTASNFQSVDLVTVTTSFNDWAPTVANLPDGVTLYWHVKVKSMTGSSSEGPYGPTVTFKKDWTRFDAATFNKPGLLQPADNAVIAYTDQAPGETINRPGFSWTPIMGATYYLLQFSKDETFAAASIVASYSTVNTTYQLLSKLADGPYFWRVLPIQDGMPDWQGAPSDYRIVTFNYNDAYRPTLISPNNNTQPEFTPTFRWTPVRGAEWYYLEISTDPTFAGVSPIPTHGNSYTPSAPLLNNQDYFWRVRVGSGKSQAKIYSETRQFRKMWYRKPILLTPTNGYQYANDPFFSWTPVPGAASYLIEVDYTNPVRATPAKKYITTNTFYAFNSKTYNCPPYGSTHGNTVYWQVTAFDANNNEGGKSLVSSFTCSPLDYGPIQVSPPMYYPSLTDPVLNPREDNTVPLPIFEWKRVLAVSTKAQSAAYRIQVADRQNIELNPGAVKYTFDTENMNAIPNLSTVLPDGGGQTDYYWRVSQLDHLNGSVIGQWSQEWRMRYNPNLLPPATATITPLRPIQGSEWVETVPLFEWVRLENATSYQIEISADSAVDPDGSFTSPIGTYTVAYPAYSHPNRLAPGTYYWHVTGMNGTTPTGWSSAIRFQIAAQSRWSCCRTLGTNNTPIIATDPAGDAGDANFDLTNLSITQGGASWYIGFNTNIGADKKYAIYIDTDHLDNSGATIDPEGYSITTIPAHQPEYVIYIYQSGGVFSRSTTLLYTWNGGGWNTPMMFSQLTGTDILRNATTGYLELVIPGNLIGQTDTVSSVSVSILSLGYSGGGPHDSVPADPSVNSAAGSAQLSRFVSVTDRINLISPSFKTDSDPTAFTTVPPIYWQPPVEVPATLFYELRIGLDVDVNDPNNITNPATPNAFNIAAVNTYDDDVKGDETSYYWQVRPWYGTSGPQGGWSQMNRLQRKGKPIQGLTVTYDQWTPTFTWNLAEGGYDYYLQIDDDPAFTSPYVDSITTKMNSYTPSSVTFVDGKVYYARVQLGRTSAITNDFSDRITFTIQRPTVTNLRTIPATSETSPARYHPTFCWDPIPSAYMYLFEIYWDAALQTRYFHEETEQNCYTAPIGLLDGEFYWRVSMKDGSKKYGPPSDITNQVFWKTYPAPTPVEPLSIEKVTGTPVFRWTGVNGADTYYLEISDKADFSTIRYKATTVDNEHQPTSKLDFGDYYWRVSIYDRDKIQGPPSNAVFIEYYKLFVPMTRK